LLLDRLNHLRPTRRRQRVLATDHRSPEPLGRIDVVKTESALVADEVALRLWIGPRPQAVHDVLVAIDVDAAPGAAIRADALLLLQIPDALFVEKVLAAQGADGAQIDDVAGQFVLQRLAGKHVNLAAVTAVDDLQFGRSSDLAREADAAR